MIRMKATNEITKEDLEKMHNAIVKFDNYISSATRKPTDENIGLYEHWIDCMSDIEKIITTENKQTKDICAMEKLKDYEDLEKQGRLVKLPCKVGDTVYVIVGKNISVQKIQRATIDSEMKIEFCTKRRGFALLDIGKTVFLKKSEAEDKLRMEMDNVLQELVKSEALEEVDRDVDIER